LSLLDGHPLPASKLRQQATKLALSLLTLLGIGQMGRIAHGQGRNLTAHPIEANRESIALIRRVTNPRHADYGKDAITAGFTFFTEAYDPAMLRFQTAAELRALMAKSDAEQRPLYINFSNRIFCAAFFPELFKIFEDKACFERTHLLYGLFENSTREIYKHTPATIGAALKP
jgi:hypothetical protein